MTETPSWQPIVLARWRLGVATLSTLLLALTLGAPAIGILAYFHGSVSVVFHTGGRLALLMMVSAFGGVGLALLAPYLIWSFASQRGEALVVRDGKLVRRLTLGGGEDSLASITSVEARGAWPFGRLTFHYSNGGTMDWPTHMVTPDAAELADAIRPLLQSRGPSA